MTHEEDGYNDPAFPQSDVNYKQDTGLTKCEYFAGVALQGLCANPNMPVILDNADLAIKFADALLEALNDQNNL